MQRARGEFGALSGYSRLPPYPISSTKTNCPCETMRVPKYKNPLLSHSKFWQAHHHKLCSTGKMASTSRVWLCLSFCFSFCLLASSLIIPNDGHQHGLLLSTNEQSPLRTTPSSVVQDCPRNNPNVDNTTFIARLWANNCDLVNKFLDNRFVTLLAKSNNTVLDSSFQYYSLQDYYYLVETIQHRAFLMQTWPPLGFNLSSQVNDTVQSMQGSVDYAEEFRQNLTNYIHVPENNIKNGELHAAVLGYAKWLQESTNLGWFGFQVARIACIYGWAEIANKLYKSSDTVPGTLFYNEWILLNLGWDYGTTMSQRFEDALANHRDSETFEVYSRLFRQGLRFEIAFFESAINKTLDSIA